MDHTRAWRPAKGQQELPFSVQRKHVLRKLQTTTTHEKHLLRVLDDHIGNRASWDCWLSLDTICSEMCCGKRTAQRAIAGCKRAGWILILARPNKRRRCSTYRLRRAEMWEAVGLDVRVALDAESNAHHSESTRLPGASISESTRPVGTSTSESTRLPGASTALHIRNEASKEDNEGVKANEGSPPPTPSTPSPTWLQVEEALFRFPISAFRQAADVANRHGCCPELVLALIDFARANSERWESPAKALHWRIVNGHPDQPVSEGWPQPRAGAARIGASDPTRIQADGPKFWNSAPVEVIE